MTPARPLTVTRLLVTGLLLLAVAGLLGAAYLLVDYRRSPDEDYAELGLLVAAALGGYSLGGLALGLPAVLVGRPVVAYACALAVGVWALLGGCATTLVLFGGAAAVPALALGVALPAAVIVLAVAGLVGSGRTG